MQRFVRLAMLRRLLTFVVAAAAAHVAAADNGFQELRKLERAAAAEPDNASAVRELAHGYALALLGADPQAATYARSALDRSNNVWILGNAAYMLQSQYNQSLQRGSVNKNAAALAERYFLRAQSLDPKLARSAILPQLDMGQFARAHQTTERERVEWDRRFEDGARRIRRLKVDAFPELPSEIAAVLRARGCTVPQPAGATTPKNVIRGEFFTPGREAWAVLCSVNGWSTILVFRNRQDSTPRELARREDRNHLQSLDQHSVGYSRQIGGVGRDYILQHDRGYAVAKPARIDHQGIDDAFLEKASEVWYCHAGRWFTLPGAD